MLTLKTYRQAADFLADVQATLEQQEALNNLQLGIADRLVHYPEKIKQPYLASVYDDRTLVVSALMTPPYRVTIHADTSLPAWQVAIDKIVDDLAGSTWTVAGVVGSIEAATYFAQRWQTITGQTYKRGLNLRVFELREVIAPPTPAGQARLAQLTEGDIAIVTEWLEAFHQEATSNSPSFDYQAWAEDRIGANTIWLWEVEGQYVSLVGIGRNTTHGKVVGPVYTPPAQRGHGYASALTALVSQHILDSGKEFASLFTDLANPTSNSIYQKIGYRPLGDSVEYDFVVD